MNTATESFFVRVEYRDFKRRINACPGCAVRRKGYETEIYDSAGDILGIVHAASIDEKGRCHPTAYYLRRVDLQQDCSRLVA